MNKKSLKDINFKKHYDSDRDDILNNFFIPALSVSLYYKRLAGFFSSGILSLASSGIANIIINGGKIKLMVGQQIQEEDFDIMKKTTINPEFYIEKMLIKEFDKIESFLSKEHREALGWMLSNDLLEIKIGVVKDGGLFHLKVGTMEDVYGNKISFSGSDNETSAGWRGNLEEFKVFKAWEQNELSWFNSDEEKFNRFWNGFGEQVVTIELPQAIKERIIFKIPKKREDLEIFKSSENKLKPFKLRPVQEEALDSWIKNNRRGILSMATGSGKTKTSLAAVKQYEESQNKNICTVIALPYSHLLTQWIDEDVVPQYPNAHILSAHGGEPAWRDKAKKALEGFSKGLFKELFIVTLYNTLSSRDFIDIISHSLVDPSQFLIIADEVHNFGALKNRKGMLDSYGMRLGLSATPERHFDEEGTAEIIKYFEKITYNYEIKDAIRDGYLVRYNYYPLLTKMTEKEFEDYLKVSKKIKRGASILSHSSKIKEDYLKMLLIARSRILKRAENKLKKLEEILIKIKKENNLNYTLIYCDDVKQLKEVQVILNNLNITNHRFTQEETIIQRKKILSNFANGIYSVLAAVKCLDEGVDVPATKTAIILASTTNPREYIQRRGRVLRLYQGKNHADIYDMVVLPLKTEDVDIEKIEKQILQKEFERISEFLDSSDNKSETYKHFLDISNEYGVYL
jgi:superfamily II DNA or RNA helicase